MRYKTPGLEGNRIAYKGRRFWVVEVLEGKSFMGYPNKEGSDFVVYDRLYGGPSASLKRQSDGSLLVETVTLLGTRAVANSLQEAAWVADAIVTREFNYLNR